MDYRIRQYLPHLRPHWVDSNDPLFITLCHKRRGVHHFDNAVAWEAILKAANHLAVRGKWRPLVLLAMPDHLHGIVRIPRTHKIQGVLGAFKRDIGHSLPTEWQRDGFDHRLRCHEYLAETFDYIALNPVRAGLISSPEKWPYRHDWRQREEGGDAARAARGAAPT